MTYLPHTPDGEILPTFSELMVMGSDELRELLQRHAKNHTRYLLDGVARGLVEARKWPIESMCHGDHRDYTYYPIGTRGTVYMDPNRARNECLHLALFFLNKRLYEEARKAERQC